MNHLKLAKYWLLGWLNPGWLKLAKPAFPILFWFISLGWLIGDVGLLASWFILGATACLFCLPVSKLSRSMFKLPELVHVEPTFTGVFSCACDSVLGGWVEDMGWSKLDVGLSGPENTNQFILKFPL